MQINFIDLLATALILAGLLGIKKNNNFWLVYAIGCLVWVELSIAVGYYFGAGMNIVACVIAISNWRRK